MLRTITCCNCKTRIKANPRLKGTSQHYCSKAECQRARKKKWQKDKLQNDEEYRLKQLDCMKHWRKERPFHSYMRRYRQDHPGYAEENRKKQITRNSGRRKTEQAAEKIVKMDALALNTSNTGTYEMTRLRRDKYGKIVKMDALIIQLRQIQQLSSFESRNPG